MCLTYIIHRLYCSEHNKIKHKDNVELRYTLPPFKFEMMVIMFYYTISKNCLIRFRRVCLTHSKRQNYSKWTANRHVGGVLCISHVAVFSWSLRGQSFGVYPSMKGLKNKSIDSLFCSSPRKSLVKGERFMRCEEKPEWRQIDVSQARQIFCRAKFVLLMFQS